MKNKSTVKKSRKKGEIFIFRPLVRPIGPCALKILGRFEAENNSDPKKIEKRVENLSFCCGVKNEFSSQTDRFSRFCSFSALGGVLLGVRAEKNWPKPLKKWIFPVFGAVLGETPAAENSIAC